MPNFLHNRDCLFCFLNSFAGCKRLTFFVCRIRKIKRSPLLKLHHLTHRSFSAFFTLQNFAIFERATQLQHNHKRTRLFLSLRLDGCCINKKLGVQTYLVGFFFDNGACVASKSCLLFFVPTLFHCLGFGRK